MVDNLNRINDLWIFKDLSGIIIILVLVIIVM